MVQAFVDSYSKKIFNLGIIEINMDIWKKLQNYSFKKMAIIFLIITGMVFFGIYATCGTIYKVDCHEVILRKFPRGF